ncbi:MAG: pkn2 [Ramlibacter sp.]|jgi:serine/threonine-protein kinase PpkA|nr:pkn2 [Ramlibacter sp.]
MLSAAVHPACVPGYRMLRQVGAGRRSTAWLASDLARGDEVVLKIQPGVHETLRHEFEVARQVAGKNIVQVREHGRAGAACYLAMDYVAGGDLAERLRAGVTVDDAGSLLRQAAQALARLHRRGYVHRDVKPQNFLMRPDGSLVLADLGLVARIGDRPAGVFGTLFGTARYVAPEQLQGAAASPAADVYSLGVLLHEMLAGAPPFAGETLMEVLSQHLVAAPPRLPAAAAALQPLVDRMLAKEAQSRLPDADAVLGQLGQRWLP